MKPFKVMSAVILGCVLLNVACQQSPTRLDNGGSDSKIQELLASVKRIEDQLNGLKDARSAQAAGSSNSAEQTELQRLEAFITSSSKEPPDLQTADQAIESFSSLNQKMSSEVQRAEVNRLLALNWNLQAVRWLASASTTDSDDQANLDDADALLEDMLTGASLELRAKIRGHVQDLQEQAKKHELKALSSGLDEVESEVASLEKNLDVEHGKALRGTLVDIEDQLRVFDIRDEDLKKLRNRFTPLLDRVDIGISIAELAAQRKRLSNLSVQVERQLALNQLLQSVVTLRVRIILDGKDKVLSSALAKLDQLRTELTAQSETESRAILDHQEKERQGYQRWALTQIDEVRKKYTVAAIDKQFNQLLDDARGGKASTFDAARFRVIRDMINEEAKIQLQSTAVSVEDGKAIVKKYGGVVTDTTRPLSQDATREAMINLLLPIDTRLLDQPVAEVYQATWSELWTSLEGASKDHRLRVAEAASVIPKATLENYRKKP